MSSRGGKPKKRGKNASAKRALATSTESGGTAKKLSQLLEDVKSQAGQEYALVTGLLGACHLKTLTQSHKTINCKIRGKLRKKVWIKVGDVVKISFRDFDENGDILEKLSEQDARAIVNHFKLENTDLVQVNRETDTSGAQDNFNFDTI